MEKYLAKKGAFITARHIEMLQELVYKNIERRLKSLVKTPGLAIISDQNGLQDDWKITDAGSSNIQIKAGLAILDNYEVIELENDSDNIAVTDDSTTYTVIATRDDDEDEEGTIAVTTGSLTLEGTGTSFEDHIEAGDWILLEGSSYSGNEVPLIVGSVTDDDTLVVESIDGDGNDVSLTTESGLTFSKIGRFASGYPAGSENENIVNHDAVEIVLTTSPGSYSNYITLGTVSNTSGSLTIVDSREDSILELRGDHKSQTASENQADSPAPDRFGGGTIWAEVMTDGTNAVLIDDTIDWRDRIISIAAYVSYPSATPSTYLPGTGQPLTGYMTILSSHALDSDSKDIAQAMFYSDNGCGASSINHAAKIINSGDDIQIFVDDGTYLTAGNLALIKDADTANQQTLLLKIDYSPVQNHY